MCCFWPAINNKQTFLAETAEKVKQEGTNAPSHLAKNFNKILGIKTKAEDLEEAGQCTAVQQWQCSVCGVAGDGPPVRGHQRIFLGSHLLWWRSALCQSAVMCLSRLPSTQYHTTAFLQRNSAILSFVMSQHSLFTGVNHTITRYAKAGYLPCDCWFRPAVGRDGLVRL